MDLESHTEVIDSYQVSASAAGSSRQGEEKRCLRNT